MKQFLFHISHYILLIGLLVSCSSDNNECTITIKPTLEAASIETAGIIGDMQLIRLETNEDCLIGDIDKIIATDDRLYIADFSLTQNVFIFDLTGKYINKIARRGRSQNEYNSLQDIFFNKEDNTINLLSRGKSKILKFDKDGGFIETHDLPAEFVEIVYLDNYYYAVAGFYAQEWCKNDNVVKFDKNNHLYGSWFPINGPQGDHRLYNRMFQYDDNIYYVDNWMFSVYNINDGNLRYKFHFAGGAQRPTHLDDANSYKKYLETEYLAYQHITSVDKVQETDGYVLASYICDGNSQLAVHNKLTNQTDAFDLGFVDKYYALPFGSLVGINESYMVSYISAKRVKTMQQGYNEYNDFREEYPEQIAKLQAMFPPILEDDNPFVAIYKLSI